MVFVLHLDICISLSCIQTQSTPSLNLLNLDFESDSESEEENLDVVTKEDTICVRKSSTSLALLTMEWVGHALDSICFNPKRF